MGLIIADQIKYFPPVFEPEYETGSHGEINPLTGAIYGAFGLTIGDYEKRSAELIRLADRTHVKGAAYSNKQKFAPVPAPDMVEDFPPEDTRGIIAIFMSPSSFTLQSGIDQDLTVEVLLGNKTPTDLAVTIEAIDLTSDSGDLTLVLSQSSFMLLSATEAIVLLAIKVPGTITGQKIIQVTGTAELDFMVQPDECILDLQPVNAPTVFYEVTGPDIYLMNTGDSVALQFMTLNGMGFPELWEFSDPVFLQMHNLEFSDSGLLSSTGVTGLPGMYQVTVFVEQDTDFGTKLFSSKIIEIALA